MTCEIHTLGYPRAALFAFCLALLAANAVALAPPRADGAPTCSWGTEPETAATLYLRLAGEPEPHALPFRRSARTAVVSVDESLWITLRTSSNPTRAPPTA